MTNLIDDETASRYWAERDTAPEAERESRNTALMDWAKAKKADQFRAEQEQAERAYTDLEGWWKDTGAGHVFENDEDRLEVANRRFIAHQFQQSPDQQGRYYPTYRDEYLQKTFGKSGLSETETFNLIRDSLSARKATEDAMREIPGTLAKGMFQSVAAGKPIEDSDGWFLLQNWKERHADKLASLPEGWESAMLDRATKLLVRSDNMMRDLAPESKRAFDTLLAFSRPEDAAGLPPADRADVENLAKEFAKLDPQQRQDIYSTLYYAAEADGAGMGKGFFEKVGEGLARGGVNIYDDAMMATEDRQIRENLRRLRSGDPVYPGPNDTVRLDREIVAPSGELIAMPQAVPLQEDFGTPLTEEQRAERLARNEQRLAELKALREIRDIAQGTIDPIKTEMDGVMGQIVQGAYDISQSLPYMGLAAVPVVGFPATMGALTSSNYLRMLDAYPDMDPDAAMTISYAIAAPMAFIERFQGRALIGKSPKFNAFMKKMTDVRIPIAGRLAIGYGVNVGVQTLQEGAQEAMVVAADQIAAAIREDMPEFDAEKAWGAYINQGPEIFYSMLWAGLIGTGASTFRELKRNGAYERRIDELEMVGITGKAAQDIAAEQDPDAATAKHREAWGKRTPEDIQAGIRKRAAQLEAARSQQDNPELPTRRIEQNADGTLTHIIERPDGTVLYRTKDSDAADMAFVNITRMVERGQITGTTTGIVESLQFIDQVNQAVARGEDIQQLVIEGAPRTLLDEYEANPTEQNLNNLFETVRAFGMDINEPAELAQFPVLASNRGALAEGIYKSVIRIQEGATGVEVMRDFSQDNLKRAVAEGRITMDWVREQLNQVIPLIESERTERRLRTETDTDVIESFSDVAVAYMNGKIRDEQIPGGLRGFLRRIAVVVKDIFRRAYRLKRAIAEGKVSGDFEAFLAESVGLDQQTVVDTTRDRVASEVLADTNFSIGANDTRLRGININDKEQDFTGQILRGEKTIETRDAPTLSPYIGRRVALVSTGRGGNPLIVGYAVVGEPKIYNSVEEFRADYNQHRVEPNSTFDIKPDGIKYGYPLTDVQQVDPTPVNVPVGRIATILDEEAAGANYSIGPKQSAGGIRFDEIAKADPKHDGSRVGTAWQGKVKPTTQDTNDGIATVKPDELEKQMAMLTQFVDGVPLPKYITKFKDAQKRMRAFLDFQKGNLLALYDAFNALSADFVIRSTHWYDGARLLAEGVRDSYRLTIEQSSAIIAVFSPMKDWFQNVAMGQRFADVMANHKNKKITKAKMGGAMREMLDAAEDDKAIRKAFKQIEGRSISQLLKDKSKEGRKLAAVATRLMSTHVHGLTHDVLSPEGESLGIRKNIDGTNKKLVWQSYTFIEKAISIYEDGSAKNISKVLGTEHKIRNFYNNIVAPTSPFGDATVDTHAVNAAVLYPMGNKGYLVGLNFGQAGVAGGGNSGLYWLFHEALREAAAERGVMPRQMQSITWEAIRGLFTDVRKRDKNFVAAITKIWETSKNADSARTQIIGLGITPPEWARVAGGNPGSQGGVGEDAGQTPVSAGSVQPGVRQGREGGDRRAGVANYSISSQAMPDALEVEAFHGTPDGSFTEFQDSPNGIFFSNKRDVAEGYTYKRGAWLSKGKNPKVISSKLRMQNPLVIDAMGARYNNIPFPGREYKRTTFGNIPQDAISVEEAAKLAFDAGHDGIVIKNVMDGSTSDDKTRSTVYAVRSFTQISPTAPSQAVPGADYSIASQREIDRVNRALSGVTRGPGERLATYERARAKFGQLMAWNRDELGAMLETGADAPTMRRTQVLQGLGELDAILSVLPPEVRGRVGGYTKLAGIAPHDVFKDGVKVSEVSGMTGAIISAWMREGQNIGQAGKQVSLPPSYTAKENLATARADKALADFFRDRIKKIDTELEKVLAREYRTAIEKMLEKALPKKSKAGVLTSTLGPEAAAFVKKAYAASLLDQDAATDRLQEIQGRLEEETDQKKVQELAEEWAVVNLFGAIDSSHSTKLASALDVLKSTIKAGRQKWKIQQDARREEIKKMVQTGLDTLGEFTSEQANLKTKQERQSALRNLKDSYNRSLAPYQLLETIFGAEHPITVQFSRKMREATNDKNLRDIEARRKFEDAARVALGFQPGERGMKVRWAIDKALLGLLEEKKGVKAFSGRRVKAVRIPVEIAEKVVRGEINLKSAQNMALDEFDEGIVTMTGSQMPRLTDAHIEAIRQELASYNERLAEADSERFAEDPNATPARRPKYISIDLVVKEGVLGERTMNAWEAMQYLATWNQPDGRAHMERNGFTEESVKQMQQLASSPFAKALYNEILKYYADNYSDHNRVFVNLYGVDMPKNINHSPLRFETQEKEQGGMRLPGERTGSGGMMPGHIKSRTKHQAELAQANMAEVFWDHVENGNYWIAWAESVRDMRAVLLNPNLMKSVTAVYGEDAATQIRDMVTLFTDGGVQMKNRAYERIYNNIVSAVSTASLGFRLSSIVNQNDAALRFMLKLSPKQQSRALVSLMQGNFVEKYKRALQSDTVQIRLAKGVSPLVRMMVENSNLPANTQLPDIIKRFLPEKLAQSATGGMQNFMLAVHMLREQGFMPMQLTDTALTSFSAAVVYESAFLEAKDAGMPDAAAEQAALDAMDDAVFRTAQPVDMAQRSMTENMALTWQRGLMQFMSDQRLKFSMWGSALRGLAKGEGDRTQHLQTLVVLGFMGIVSETLRAWYRDFFTDDDDEEIYKPSNWIRAFLVGPLTGFWWYGTILDTMLRGFLGERTFGMAGQLDAFLKDIERISRNPEPLYDWSDESRSLGAWKAAARVAGGLYAPAQVISLPLNIVEPVLGASENIQAEE